MTAEELELARLEADLAAAKERLRVFREYVELTALPARRRQAPRARGPAPLSAEERAVRDTLPMDESRRERYLREHGRKAG